MKDFNIKCLTIEQAKGLEFEDVIIWDFFSKSKCSKRMWSTFLFSLNVSESQITEDMFFNKFSCNYYF